MLRTLQFIASHPLNQSGRLSAISRFARWQLKSRLRSGPHRIPFVDDTVLMMERGMTGATGNWYCGLHEHNDMGFVLHFLRDGDLFLDIGANVGSYSVLAAGCAGAQVDAFEPIPNTFERLSRNIQANGLAALARCHNIGLGEETSELLFSADSDTMNHVVTAEEAKRVRTVNVPVRRIDDVIGERAARLAKIDVEGWEAQVLKGMPKALADPELAAVIMETNDSSDRYDGEGQDEAGAMMQAAGFRPCGYDPFKRELIEGGSAHNTIFVRDFDTVLKRVESARRFRLVNGSI